MRTRSAIIGAASIGLTLAVGVTGCGQAQKLSAKDAVSNAFSGLESAKSATFTVKLDSTVPDIEAIAEAQGDPVDADDKKILPAVLAGDVVISVEAPAGKTLGDSARSSQSRAAKQGLELLKDPQALDAALKSSGNSSISVRSAGSPVFELRSVKGLVYARADGKRILKLAGQDPAQLDQAIAGLPISMAPLANAAKGSWVSIDLGAAATAAKQKGLLNAIPTSSAVPTVDAARVQHLIDSFKAAYQQKATITTLGDAGDRGTGYRLSAPAKQVAQAVQDDLIALAGKDAGAEIRKGIADLPERNVALDVWVKDDTLTGAALDLTQFLDKPVAGKKLAVDLAVDVDSGAVAAPTGAAALDVKGLLAQIPADAFKQMAAAGGAATSSSGGSLGLGTSGRIGDAQMEQLKQQTGLSEKEIRDLMKQSGT